jgi:hypothetical protein
MGNPVRIRIRGTEKVRGLWKKAEGEFDLTYAELAINLCQFALDNKAEFRRHLQSEKRTG